MENLVSELENLNVDQINISEIENRIFTGQRLSSTVKKRFFNMSSDKVAAAVEFDNHATDDESEADTSESESPDEVDNGDTEQLKNAQTNKFKSEKIRGGVNTRTLPRRSAKQSPLFSNSLRTPMKPQKINAKSTQKLSPAEIEKIYTKQKLTKFRPTSLETIFEEPQPATQRGSEQFRLIGVKKLRRSLVVSDGFNINKAIVNRRRAKIKKFRKKRCTVQKISLEKFLSYMRENGLNMENEQKDVNVKDKTQNETCEAVLLPQSQPTNEIEDFEMEMSPKCNT